MSGDKTMCQHIPGVPLLAQIPHSPCFLPSVSRELPTTKILQGGQNGSLLNHVLCVDCVPCLYARKCRLGRES